MPEISYQLEEDPRKLISLSLSLSLPCCDAEIEGQEPSDLNCVIDCDGG